VRLLLTGGTGFVGRHVLAAAQGAGVDVVRATRTQTGDFAGAIAAAEPDVIVHCAGVTTAPDAAAMQTVNVELSAALLEAVAEQSRPPRVILIGSAAEYGHVPASALPVREDWPCRPVTDYAASKHRQTLLGLALSERGYPISIARLFNPVGADMPRHLALPAIADRLTAAGAGGVVRVGNLDVARDFIDVREAARIILALAAMETPPWPLVNVCSGRSARLGDLVGQMVALGGFDVALEPDPALIRPDEAPDLTGSADRLEQLGLPPRSPDWADLLPGILAGAVEAQE
jgi:nucleoside-diphosphate-sugar epimerase